MLYKGSNAIIKILAITLTMPVMDTTCMDIEYVPTQVANHMEVIYNQFLNLTK